MMSHDLANARYVLSHCRSPNGELHLSKADTIELLNFLSVVQGGVEMLEESHFQHKGEIEEPNNVVYLFPNSQTQSLRKDN